MSKEKEKEKMTSAANELKSLLRHIKEIASFATRTVNLNWNALNLTIGGSCGKYTYQREHTGHETFTIQVPQDLNAWNMIKTLVHEYGHVCVARLKTGVDRLPGIQFTRDHGEFIALVFGWFAVSDEWVDPSEFGLYTGKSEQDRANAMQNAYDLFIQNQIIYAEDSPYGSTYLSQYQSSIPTAYFDLLVFVNHQYTEMIMYHEHQRRRF